MIAAKAADYDLVICADFGHGLVNKSSIDILTSTARFLAVNSQSNSANLGYNLITKYPRADYICIDHSEARLAVSDRVSTVGDVARTLVNNRVDCSKIIITQGKHGCVTYERGGIVHTIPAFTDNVIDTVGAGDAFLSVTAPLVAAGGLMHRIGFIGNVAGALKVQIVGHRRSIDKPSVIKAITGLLR
jgi:sugar/nucleoside kinase (ribokinase family)